jgi:hypothetical protein
VDSLEKKFIAYGTTQIDAAADAVILIAPVNYGFYKRQWLDKTITEIGGGVWEFVVPYGLGHLPGLAVGGTTPSGDRPTFTLPGEDDPLTREWSLDFSQGSRKITKSIKNFGGQDALGQDYPGPSDFPPRDIGDDPWFEGSEGFSPRGGAINRNPKTGEVDGIEVGDAVQRIQVQAVLPAVTQRYYSLLCELQLHVNTQPFLSRDPGAVLFVGAQFGAKVSDGTTGTYTFDIRKNRAEVKISDQMTVPFIRGWDYLEVFYDWELVDETEDRFDLLPQFYQVHQVYEYGDLNRLFGG